MNAPAQQSTGQDPQQLFNNISNTYSAIERGDWVNAGLGMANTAMGIVGMASNPLSGFLSAGFSWAIQHVDFLREPFDMLLGSPESISKMAQSYRSAGQQVQGIATEYRRICVQQTREWQGKAATAYRAAAQKHASGMDALSKATHGIAAAVEGAGKLVAEVRKQIMDLISQAVSDMVMKIIQWLAASFLTFGAAIAGAIADIVSTAVRYAQKLADFLQKLLGSVQKLMNLIKQVQQIAKVAEQIIDAISSMAHKGAGGGGGGVNRPTHGGFDGIRADQQDRASAGAGGTFTSGAGGGHTGGTITAGAGPQVTPVYTPPGGVPGGYPSGGGAGGGAGGHVAPVYTPPGSSQGGNPGGRPPGGGSGGQVSPGYTPPGSGSGGSGSGGSGTGGPGRWVPGHWEPSTNTTTTAGGSVTKPPSFGSTPTTTNADWYRPSTDHSASAASSTSSAGGGGGGGAGGGMPKGMGGGGGGGIPAGAFGGGPAGGGGAGTAATQFGGAAGVMPAGGGGAAPAGGVPHGPGGGGGPGGAAGGMMGGAPMAGAAGQQGGSNEHKRKVRIEGEALVDPPKAAKPVIGE